MSILKSIETQIAPLTLAVLRATSGALFFGHGLVKVVGFPAGGRVDGLLSGRVDARTGLAVPISSAP